MAKDKDIIAKVLKRLEKKDQVWKERANVVEYQSNILRKLVPITSSDGSSLENGLQYRSALTHKIINFLRTAKIFPSFVDFRNENTNSPDEARVQAENVTMVHRTMRRKGGYKKATIEASYDLVRGECFIARDIKKDRDGEPLRFEYYHVPWDQVRWFYGDEDVIIVSMLTKDKATQKFGEKVVKGVSSPSIYNNLDNKNIRNNATINAIKKDNEKYSYIRYINQATLEEYEILGDKIVTKLTGDDFMNSDEEGDSFTPIQRRTFYAPTDKFFGYGVFDMILPLIRMDETHGNALVARSIDEADPLTIVASDNPIDLKRKHRQHTANRSARKTGNLFFVKKDQFGSKLETQTVSTPANVGLFDFIDNFIVDRIAMLTDINLKSLIEFAPTDSQDARRQELQDRLNLGVLYNNSESDSDFAKQDLIVLQKTDTKFHEKELYFSVSAEDIDGNTEGLTSPDGTIMPITQSVREFLDEIEDLDFEIEARLEGVLDDSTRFELREMKDALLLIPQGTDAYNQALERYMSKVAPFYNITKEQLSVAPEQPQQALPK